MSKREHAIRAAPVRKRLRCVVEWFGKRAARVIEPQRFGWRFAISPICAADASHVTADASGSHLATFAAHCQPNSPLNTK